MSIPPAVRLTSPTFDFRLETSFCNEDNAFFTAPISPAEDEPLTGGNAIIAVSYTHLTLPTILLV